MQVASITKVLYNIFLCQFIWCGKFVHAVQYNLGCLFYFLILPSKSNAVILRLVFIKLQLTFIEGLFLLEVV